MHHSAASASQPIFASTASPAVSHLSAAALGALLFALSAGCESSDPHASGPDGGVGGGAAACAADEGLTAHDGQGCVPDPDDYQPRVGGSANDSWPACISDDNTYHPFGASVSSNARTAAFESIATLLGFGQARSPDPQAFVDARVAYTQPEGLDSRVSRREDEHYPAAPKKCRDMTASELQGYPDRCVGPAQMQPILNDAFAQGSEGIDPVRNAARIEAVLLWFFYVAIYKESTTCTDKAADCDSATGYYAGGQARSPSLGFARYLEARSPQAHDASWDALLAVRCWRDLDNPTGVATDLVTRDKALAQLDRALDRDLALIVRQRLGALPCESAWVSAQMLGAALDRAAAARDPAQATILRAELAKPSAAEADAEGAIAALDAMFPCP